MRDEQPGSYFRGKLSETIFWVEILKFFDADPGSGLVKLMVDADLAALGINLNKGGDSEQLLKDLAYLRNRSLIAVD